VTTPVTGVFKTPPNPTILIWFCSQIHADFKYAKSFSRIVVENQKRREKVLKLKTQSYDSGQNKPN
jgi:hypothetical protein